MGGLTLITALEIYTNPFDLDIIITEDALMMSRGPGHNFKILLSGEWKFSDKIIIAEDIKNILKTIIDKNNTEISKPGSFVASICNPNNEPLNKAIVLTDNMLSEIILSLSKRGMVQTYQPPFSCCGAPLAWNVVSPPWYNYKIEESSCGACKKVYQRKDKDGICYIKEGDGFLCSACRGEVNALIIKHSVHDGPFPLSGSGKVVDEAVPYCEECEAIPDKIIGTPVNKTNVK